MDTRQKIREEEEHIRRLLREKGEEETAAKRAWNKMIDYFTAYDYLEGNTHVSIINYIYLKRQHENETYFCMAWKNHIGERTLYRYRKKYIVCFNYYFNEEGENEREKVRAV